VTIGIIGTAGRAEDCSKLTNSLYQKTGKQIFKLIQEFGATKLVSGGAAGIDHLAVSIFLRYPCELTLHLPAKFDADLSNKYIEGPGKFNPGAVANYYHKRFSIILGRSSLLDISSAIYKGAVAQLTPGFKERNTKVAEDADILIAATFGDGKNLKPGGTLDTWNKFTNLKPTNKKFHIDLHTGLVYDC
jgi:hypothetical protein